MSEEQLRLDDTRSIREEHSPDEIPVGYKKTEVGVIPEDWGVKSLRDCLVGQPEYGINAPAVSYSENLPTYIRITDITDEGRFSSENIASVATDSYHNFLLTDGDVVFARTGASVGKYYRYRPGDGALVFAGFLIRVHPDRSKLLPQFLEAYLGTASYWNWVRLMSTRSGQPGINGKEYSILPVPVTSIAEQTAVAEALTDVDNLIASLDNLISKKQAIREATMQQLLTGRTRLPGFEGEWELVTIGSLGSIYGGLSGKNKQDFGEGNAFYVTFLNVLQNSVIDPNQFERVNVLKWESQNIVRKGDLLFNGTSETPDELAMGATVSDDFGELYLNSFCFGFRIHDQASWNSLFFAYLFRSCVGRKMLRALSQGATRHNLSKVQFLRLIVRVPSYLEQTAIVSTLLDMDNEITALENQRNKTKQIKQGMMQQLLTGRIRLLDKEAV